MPPSSLLIFITAVYVYYCSVRYVRYVTLCVVITHSCLFYVSVHASYYPCWFRLFVPLVFAVIVDCLPHLCLRYVITFQLCVLCITHSRCPGRFLPHRVRSFALCCVCYPFFCGYGSSLRWLVPLLVCCVVTVTFTLVVPFTCC